MPDQVFARRPDKIYLHNYYQDARALLCAGGAAAHRPGAPARGRSHSIPHTLPARPRAQGLGEAEMNQTRFLPTKSPQSAGGDDTHINYSDPGWLGTRARHGYERQAGQRRGWGVISLSKSGSRTKPEMGLCRAIQPLQLCWSLLCLEGLRALATLPAAGLRVSAAAPPSGPHPHSVLPVPSPEAALEACSPPPLPHLLSKPLSL